MFKKQLLEEFDAFLGERALRLDAVAVGGGALLLLGITQRRTLDLDILHPMLSVEVSAAASEFAQLQGGRLAADWLNNGPSELAACLPGGWEERVQLAFEGRVIRLMALGRGDLLCSKLFALCDRGTDLSDCLALAPSAEELREAQPWVCEQDGNPMWPDHVRDTLRDLARRLGHAV